MAVVVGGDGQQMHQVFLGRFCEDFLVEVELVGGVVLVERVEVGDIFAVGVGIGECKLGLLVFGPEEMLEYHLELAGLPHDEGRFGGDALPVGPGVAGGGLISEDRSVAFGGVVLNR